MIEFNNYNSDEFYRNNEIIRNIYIKYCQKYNSAPRAAND